MTLTLFIFTILLSYILSISFEIIFRKFQWFIDTPNSRSSHLSPTPSAGGLAIIFSYIIYLIGLSFINVIDKTTLGVLFIILLPVMLIGLLDDLKETKISLRLIIQFLSASFLIYYFQINSNWVPDFIFTQSSFLIISLSVVLSVWLMNLYNFMDGIDGYAGTQAVLIFSFAAILAFLNKPEENMYLYLIGFAFANFGFLLRNWYPAKIFMGDTGSVSIGFVIAFFIFFSASESIISIYTWLILLSIFISDATYTLFVRTVTKKNLTKPHLTHGFHILSKSKKSQENVTIYMILFNIFWILPLALISNTFIEFHILVTIVAYVPLLFILLKLGAGLEDKFRLN